MLNNSSKFKIFKIWIFTKNRYQNSNLRNNKNTKMINYKIKLTNYNLIKMFWMSTNETF